MPSSSIHSPFPSTRWTAVFKACAEGDEGSARQALEELCAAYWYPLYAFARRLGRGPHEAQDLTQGFFANLLRDGLFAAADPQIGKLRTFLLVAFQRYIGNVREHETRQKRGGGCEIIPIAAAVGELRYQREPADPATPELFFERSWALSVVNDVLRQLGLAEAQAGRGEVFHVIEPFISPDTPGETDYAAAAVRLGLSEEAARQAVSRLRRRFREQLRRQIAQTLREPDDALIAEEIAALRAALRI